MLIFILALVVYSRAYLKIDLGGNGPMTAQGLKARVDYLKTKNSVVDSTVDSASKFTIKIIQKPVDTSTVHQLEVRLSAKNSAGASVDPPGFYSEILNGNEILTIPYTSNQITDFYGCWELPYHPNYVGKMCDFTLNYVASELGVVLATDFFSVAIKIPRQGSSIMTVNAKRIYRNLRELQESNEYPLIIEVFTDPDCTVKLVGNEVTYGDRICMKLTTTDNLASTYDFETRSIVLYYFRSHDEVEIMEMIKTSDIKDGKGISKINTDVLSVGDSSFNIAVVLKKKDIAGGNKLVDDIMIGKVLRGDSPTLTVKKPQLKNLEVLEKTNSAISVSVSLTLILLGILAILV